MSYKLDDDWSEALTWMVLPAGRAWQRAAGAALAQHNISLSRAAPILVVSRLGDGIQQKTIADEAGIDSAAIVRSLDELEREGLLKRKSDPFDRRAKTVHLTLKGRNLAKELDKVIRELRTGIIASIRREDGKVAVKVLRELERASNDRDGSLLNF